VIRHFGQADVYVPVTAGIVAAGLLTHQPEVTRAGGRVALALVLTAAMTGGAKITIGRARPNESTDAFDFQPFSGQESMPSGHTSMAFAFATALSDEIHRPVATVGLYGLATGVGWSRIHDNEHWLSDVGAGAILGITCAKLANGHWRIFHLHPPTILVTPQSAGLGWQAAF
jgi:membrane-associated phospholipid phosphatase